MHTRGPSSIILCLLLCIATGCKPHQDSLGAETQRIEAWRQHRAASLTSESGWLTLAGLYWLKPGSNRFGRDSRNDLVLNHPSMPDTAGVFDVRKSVSFIAEPNSGVMLEGEPVTQINLASDITEKPTILSLGPLRFYLIERAGQFGVRVRDIEHPARKTFKGLEYFPISTDWRINARYEAYVPSKSITIVNILGMTEQMESPGALVFEHEGRSWRLDAILESPADAELFVMFTDATSGRDTYGAGRYLYVPKPIGTQVWLDFNQAFNPPCAFTAFATCPLPPRQNRLELAVTAGEKKYAAP